MRIDCFEMIKVKFSVSPLDCDRPIKRLRGAYFSRVGIERLSAVRIKELNVSELYEEVSKRIGLHQK